MLRTVLKISWREKIKNKVLYKDIPPIAETIRQRRLRFAGHCWRKKDEVVHKLLLWNPNHGNRGRGRPRKSYTKQLAEDTGLDLQQLPAAMDDKEGWRKLVMWRLAGVSK